MQATKTNQKTVVVERIIPSDTIGLDIASRLSGKLLGFDDLFDPKTGHFLTADELVKKGASFVTVQMDKVLGKSDLVVKSRITKEPTPYIRKSTRYQVIVNINWQSYINKRGQGDFIPKDYKTNGITDVECKGIGKTTKDNYTLNGVVFNVIESSRYFDEQGVEYPDKTALRDEYFKQTTKQLNKNAQREADKHGIDVRFDPKYRTTRIDSCSSIRAFGFDFRPKENHKNK